MDPRVLRSLGGGPGAGSTVLAEVLVLDSLLGPQRPVLSGWRLARTPSGSRRPVYPPGKARPVRLSRCPLYGFVDATGRGCGAVFTCEVPYQG